MTITDTDYDLLRQELMVDIRKFTVGIIGIGILGNELDSSPDAMAEATKVLENALCQNLVRKMCDKLKEKTEASIN